MVAWTAAMISAFFLSVGQLGDRAFVRVFAMSMAVTLALFAMLGVGVWFGTEAALAQWLDYDSAGLSAVFALFVSVLALWLLFRAVAIGVIGIFADDVVAAVEARHYPAALASARPVGIARSMTMGVRSAARVVFVNLAMLPIYVALLVTGSAPRRRSSSSMAGCSGAIWATWSRRGIWIVRRCETGARRPPRAASCWGLRPPRCSWFRC